MRPRRPGSGGCGRRRCGSPCCGCRAWKRLELPAGKLFRDIDLWLLSYASPLHFSSQLCGPEKFLCLRDTLPLEEKAEIVRLPGNAGDLECQLASFSTLRGKAVEYFSPSAIVLDLVPNEHMYHRCAPFIFLSGLGEASASEAFDEHRAVDPRTVRRRQVESGGGRRRTVQAPPTASPS